MLRAHPRALHLAHRGGGGLDDASPRGLDVGEALGILGGFVVLGVFFCVVVKYLDVGETLGILVDFSVFLVCLGCFCFSLSH